MRQATITRKTKETSIELTLDLDNPVEGPVDTGSGFLDHMLDLFRAHSGCGLTLVCKGDTHIDLHHSVEDIGIALGEALRQAVGDKKGVERYGFYYVTMDEALARVAVDFGGRPWLVWEATFDREKIGDLPTELFFHLFKSFSDAARCNLNIRVEGQNEHHKIEAVFKAFARAIRMAVKQDAENRELPSTKGVL